MTPDQYGWRSASKEEVDLLVKRLDLVRVFHSVADTSLWYLRSEAESCKDYMECTPFARRNELYGGEYEINQKNVEARQKVSDT